jgi:hypothetical protein
MGAGIKGVKIKRTESDVPHKTTITEKEKKKKKRRGRLVLKAAGRIFHLIN